MAINRISLYHLETLIWIARLGTFAAAADKLNTTQPGISARISELEERLGAKLFQRNGRAANLTPAGRELVREYQPVWEKLQGILLRTAGFDQIRGIARVGAGEIAAATCLPSFVADMKKRWPELTLEIDIELTANMVQALLGGKIDIAFTAGTVAHPALEATSIGTVDLLWVASPQVVAQIESRQSEPSLSPWSLPGHSPIYQIMKTALENFPVRLGSVNLCNNVRTMIDIVAQGTGFALMPKSMVQPQLNLGTLVAVKNQPPVAPLFFQVVMRAGEGDPIIKEIVDRAKLINIRS